MLLVSICHCTHAEYIYRSESFGGSMQTLLKLRMSLISRSRSPGPPLMVRLWCRHITQPNCLGLSCTPATAVNGTEISYCPEKATTHVLCSSMSFFIVKALVWVCAFNSKKALLYWDIVKLALTTLLTPPLHFGLLFHAGEEEGDGGWPIYHRGNKLLKFNAEI